MLERFGVKTRIFGGFTAILIMLGGVAYLSSDSARRAGAAFDGYGAAAERLERLSDMRAGLTEARLEVAGALLTHVARPLEKAPVIDQALTRLIAPEGEDATLLAAPEIAEDVAALQAAAKVWLESYDAYLQTRKDYLRASAPLTPDLRDATKRFKAMITNAHGAGIAADIVNVANANSAFLLAQKDIAKAILTDSKYAYRDAGKSLEKAAVALDETAQSANPDIAMDARGAANALRSYAQGLGPLAELAATRFDLTSQVLIGQGPVLIEYLDAIATHVRNASEQSLFLSTEEIQTSRMDIERNSLIALGLGVAIALSTGFWTARSLNRITRKMSRLANGDLDIEVTGDQRRHELGRMARALKVFQRNQQEKRRLDHARQEAAARERAEQAELAALQDDLRRAVVKAAAGDFSTRIAARYRDPAFNDMAQLMNGLMSDTGDSVGGVAKVMDSLSTGDLDAHMDGEFHGAFESLQNNVNATVRRLRETMGEITQSSRSVHGSGGEIASVARDLSTRAEHQAANLEEVAATIEEMAASVKTNADNAAIASKLSTEARSQADTGAAVVTRATTAMSEIRQSATRISDIVNVIDGFAFQTNLLALNAAVEAARAGEAGKGFAVVASEVRSLAQRSADAARDIKALIEVSSGHVSEGAQLVEETGAALTAITEAVRKASRTIDEISQASREQAGGVDEITASMSALDETTQRNAAIAEQSSAAATDLADEAGRLEEMVAFFHMTPGSPAREVA